MVSNFISMEVNLAFKINKTLIKSHIEYCALASTPASRKLECNINTGGYKRKVIKTIKSFKDYSSPVVRKTWVQYQVESYQRLKNCT